jgi:hypothetical protein
LALRRPDRAWLRKQRAFQATSQNGLGVSLTSLRVVVLTPTARRKEHVSRNHRLPNVCDVWRQRSRGLRLLTSGHDNSACNVPLLGMAVRERSCSVVGSTHVARAMAGRPLRRLVRAVLAVFIAASWPWIVLSTRRQRPAMSDALEMHRSAPRLVNSVEQVAQTRVPNAGAFKPARFGQTQIRRRTVYR